MFNRKHGLFPSRGNIFSEHLSYFWKSLSRTGMPINKSLPHFIGFWRKFSTGHSSLCESYVSSVASLVMSSRWWSVVLKHPERNWKSASDFLYFHFSSVCHSLTVCSYFSNILPAENSLEVESCSSLKNTVTLSEIGQVFFYKETFYKWGKSHLYREINIYVNIYICVSMPIFSL